jgi:hypothetical protein
MKATFEISRRFTVDLIITKMIRVLAVQVEGFLKLSLKPKIKDKDEIKGSVEH